ncbi:glycosyltransferase family 4 protein [uncultured Friedmanniella sp.]|uniref:glycosyltransferase family 4 protein n=1 Tax=uncultured Friedmanniella sp. TaxID=335381 RepID=UPI0035CBB284
MSSDGLRVGLVCPYSFERPGGVQNHVLGLAAHLRDAGHDPYVLGCGDPAALAGVDLADDDLRRRFTSAGRAWPVRYNGSVARLTFGPGSARRVRRWLAEHDLDLLHVHEPMTPSVSVLALWAASVPVVATFHTATPRSRSMRLAGGTMRGTVAKIDAGIAVSAPARQVVRQYLDRDARLIPNGFRVADFSPAQRSGGPWRGGARPRLVFLGRVEEPRKGLDVLLAALPAIRAAVPGLEVVVAGHGHRALPAGIRREADVRDADKAALLAGADVFVAPHTERESFGIVLLEAMASGAPVVASDLPAFTALLQHDPDAPGRALGEIFPAGDAPALAAAVRTVLAGPDPVRVQRGLQHARRFDWAEVGPQVVSVYRDVLSPHGADPPPRLPVGAGHAPAT